MHSPVKFSPEQMVAPASGARASSGTAAARPKKATRVVAMESCMLAG